jgi:hypothetical protein
MNAANPSAPTVVTTDIRCRKCGYNLRGLGTDARCPECGVAVAASISGDLLRYCDPDWVALLAQGSKIIIAGFIVIFLGIITSIALFFAIGPGSSVVGPLGIFAGNVLIVIGSWLITTPDPSGVGEDKYGTVRKTIRVTLLIGAINTLIAMIVQFAPPPPMAAQMIFVIGEVAGIVGVVGLFAELQYYEKLADRIPDPRLSKRARFLKKWFPGLSLVFFIGGNVMRLLIRNTPPNTIFFAFAPFLTLIEIATLIAGLVYLLMIGRFSKRFKEQALLAAQNWATHAADPAKQ